MCQSEHALACGEGGRRPNKTLQHDQLTKRPTFRTVQLQVTIFKPSRVATQQGLGNTMEWKIDFGVKDKWENPLMGWVSTGDPVACVGNATLTFDTKDAAIAFCKKYGWAYEVVEPNENSKTRPQRFQGYADNFSVKRGGLPILPGAKAEPEDDW